MPVLGQQLQGMVILENTQILNVYFHVLFACLSEFSHFLSSCLGIITLAFLREKTTILYLFAIIYLLIFTIIYLLSTIIIKYYYLLISFLEINLKYAKQN